MTVLHFGAKVAASMALLLGVAACGKSSGGGSASSSKSGPVVRELKSESRDYGIVFEQPRCKGTISVLESNVALEVPAGTTVVLDGRALAVNGTKVEAPFLLGESAAALDLVALAKGEAKASVKLVLMSPNSDRDEATFPLTGPQVKKLFGVALKSIDKGPLLFGAEAPNGAKPRTLLAVHTSADGVVELWPALGGAKKPAEVDLVAVLQRSSRTLDCPPYYAGGDTYSVHRYLFDEDARVFERRTGKEVGHKKFEAKEPVCAATTKSDFFSEVPKEDVTKWLESLLGA